MRRLKLALILLFSVADGQGRREGRGYAGDQSFRGWEDLDDDHPRRRPNRAKHPRV